MSALNTRPPTSEVPTLTGGPRARVKLSAITSSIEEMPISEFLAELWVIRVFAIDLYVRGCDVAAALKLPMVSLEHESLIDRLSANDRNINVRQIANYVRSEKELAARLIAKRYGEKVPPEAFHIPALATFIPELTSGDPDIAHKGALALNSMVDLAGQLGAHVVEFVMGKIVERCRAQPLGDEHHCDFIHEHDPKDQIREAVKLLKAEVCPLAEKVHVRLAAEIEPGFSYVLNDIDRVGQYIDAVRAEGVEDLLGLNLDIGHLLIVNTSFPGHFEPGDMKTRSQHIFHAHCSDNVGYHFRDLVPGTVHDLFGGSDTDFQPWVDVCLHCAKKPSFSGYIAVELEGCSRIQWVQRSLLRLGYLIRTIEDQRHPFTEASARSHRKRNRSPSVKSKTPRAKKLQRSKTVLILTVREEELKAVTATFKKHCRANRGDLKYREDKALYEGLFFCTEQQRQVQIVIGQCRDTGNQTSGVDTSYYLAKCKELYEGSLSYAILVGICAGSPKRKAKLGDVVVPPYIFDNSVYKLEIIDGRQTRLNELRSPGTPDARLHRLCRGISQVRKWTQAVRVTRPASVAGTPTVHFDPMFTDNVFLADAGEYLEECRNSINRKGLAYEMEAGGFANACHSEGVPFLVIRGISDFADATASDVKFRPYAASTAAAFALAVAKPAVIPG